MRQHPTERGPSRSRRGSCCALVDGNHDDSANWTISNSDAASASQKCRAHTKVAPANFRKSPFSHRQPSPHHAAGSAQAQLSHLAASVARHDYRTEIRTRDFRNFQETQVVSLPSSHTTLALRIHKSLARREAAPENRTCAPPAKFRKTPGLSLVPFGIHRSSFICLPLRVSVPPSLSAGPYFPIFPVVSRRKRLGVENMERYTPVFPRETPISTSAKNFSAGGRDAKPWFSRAIGRAHGGMRWKIWKVSEPRSRNCHTGNDFERSRDGNYE